jgi:hypothetical protein
LSCLPFNELIDELIILGKEIRALEAFVDGPLPEDEDRARMVRTVIVSHEEANRRADLHREG